MMIGPITIWRRLFERSPERAASLGIAGELPCVEQRQPEMAPTTASTRREERSAAPGRGAAEGRQWPVGHAEGAELPRQTAAGGAGIAGLVAGYLGSRAEEILSQLCEAVSRSIAGEVGRTVRDAQDALGAELAGIRQSNETGQREWSRMGRELMRTGASVEGVQVSVAELGATLLMIDAALQSERRDASQTAAELRDEIWGTVVGDLLATLDGLEAALDEARNIGEGLARVSRQIDDPVVRRWWRAMGEATGVKRALPTLPKDELAAWQRGLEVTYRRLSDALERRGVEAIAGKGQRFDPHVHEAVAVKSCEPELDGVVLGEELRGYRTADRVIRLAQVVVGKAALPVEQATRARGKGMSSDDGRTDDVAVSVEERPVE